MDTDKYIRAQARATWVIAFFTVVLAGASIQQCYILRESDRPSLLTAFSMARETFPQSGQKMRTDLVLANSGKTVTMAYVKSTFMYSLEKMDAPPLPETETRTLVWPGNSASVKMESPTEITDGQISDMIAGRGYIYERAYVRYGNKGQYHAAICSESRVLTTPAGPFPFVRENTGLCKDPDSNRAN